MDQWGVEAQQFRLLNEVNGATKRLKDVAGRAGILAACQLALADVRQNHPGLFPANSGLTAADDAEAAQAAAQVYISRSGQ